MKKPEWKKLIENTQAKVFKEQIVKKLFLALLERGHLPRQLPPPFNSRGFSEMAEKIPDKFSVAISDRLYKQTAQHCFYSLARPGQLRRVLSIVNPAYHYLLSLKLADVYVKRDLIRDFSEEHYFSMSWPTYHEEGTNRALEFSKDWSDVPLRRLRVRAEKRYLVKADIARFFPSIYTHSIPWAMHGKQVAKKKQKDMGLDGNFIDMLVRRAQDGQTLGLPIGPDTSFVISEIILNKIDEFIYEKIKSLNIACFHTVDDYEFSCLTREQADLCLAVLQEALQQFELELNTLKTEILQLPQPIQDPEVARLRSYSFGEEPTATELLEFFDLAFECFTKHPKGVLKYAIKRLPIAQEHYRMISDFMTQCMLLEPGVIEAVFYWLSKADATDMVNRESFSSVLTHIIVEHSVLGHSSEVAWAIWGFILLQEKLPQVAEDALVKMRDSTVLLLACDAYKKGFISSNPLKEHSKFVFTAEQLYGRHWLLAYEAVRQKWVPTKLREHVKNDPVFSLMLEHGVSFYDVQDIASYHETMKNWQPYDIYSDDADEPDEDDEDNEPMPF